jgi:hypothetical protein
MYTYRFLIYTFFFTNDIYIIYEGNVLFSKLVQYMKEMFTGNNIIMPFQ